MVKLNSEKDIRAGQQEIWSKIQESSSPQSSLWPLTLEDQSSYMIFPAEMSRLRAPGEGGGEGRGCDLDMTTAGSRRVKWDLKGLGANSCLFMW